jgi:GNAT superfamily N-acetyltransferase
MEPSLSFRFAGLDDINSIGFLAQQIWPAAYGEILSSAQLDYMLKLFYSPASLRKQMTEDRHRFVMVEDDDEAIGFASWSLSEKPGLFKLHKLYVLTGRQGKGMGKALLHFIFDEVRAQGANVLRLNVNRHNKARRFYEKMGFAVVGEEDVPIGNNYFMNDYVMEASL